MNFRISDIPDGKSARELTLEGGQIDLEDASHGPVDLKVAFNKQHGIITVVFAVKTTLQLVCDRSLDPFPLPVDTRYEVLFKPEAEPSEDESFAVRPLEVSKNLISIKNEVRDSILLSIPIKKLHPRYIKEDGTPTDFNETFGDTDEDSETGSDQIDPRWEALKKLNINQNN